MCGFYFGPIRWFAVTPRILHDSSWRFRFIAMLATVKNDGHNAPLVAKLIETEFKVKYDIDIRV
ncbi:hypothetical protein GQ600_12476 [Phytophthora cactorum]|nr:hypothetical protein GQ600_12476 [Phytophthora cactorum]